MRNGLYLSWLWKKNTGALAATMSCMSAIVCGCSWTAAVVATGPLLLLKFQKRSRAGFPPNSAAYIILIITPASRLTLLHISLLLPFLK